MAIFRPTTAQHENGSFRSPSAGYPALISASALAAWSLIDLAVYFTIGKVSWSRGDIYLTLAALDLSQNIILITIKTTFVNFDRKFLL
jgi:hypothetical protein